MHTFYIPDLDNEMVFLSEEESKHAVKVLRLKLDDACLAINGKGKSAKVSISEIHKKTVQLKVVEVLTNQDKPPFELTLCLAPTKRSERMEWMIEKLVEVGIFKLVLMQTDNSERSRISITRLHKKAMSALKQSGQLWLPEIVEAKNFEAVVKSFKSELNFLAHCRETEKVTLKAIPTKVKSVTICIGPEGDFTPSEIEHSIKHGFQSLSLGSSRLRTETAGLVACTLINHFYVTLAE
ncbi:MAG: 16S rRNA (uracil1498-N3)-methyltransferase [Bacteroidia bacterium]|jgi:16S rRNA (uracil1498-N3)-methyltransferase